MSNQAAIKQKFERLRPAMNEQMRRFWAANEAIAHGKGGERIVSLATGLSRATIHSGIEELKGLPVTLADAPLLHRRNGSNSARANSRIRRPGGGRKLTEQKNPAIVAALEKLVSGEVGGDPMTGQVWVRSSLRRLSSRLKENGFQASGQTVRRLLTNMGFSLKANKRKTSKRGCVERDAQFKYIMSQRNRFTDEGLPVISVDTKKKELIGEFRKSGRTWCKKPDEVHEHDFPGANQLRAVPLGVYDLAKNAGYVYVGLSHDTPEFAVNSISRWWRDTGRQNYPTARELLILVDAGGCNGCQIKAWKVNLQRSLCDQFGLSVTICHYPTGCSKWNPVEHRLFSYISINWAGKPMKTLEMMLGYIRGTTTLTGLKVKAFSDKRTYARGQEVTREEQDCMNLTFHKVCPQWNYTLRPAFRTM